MCAKFLRKRKLPHQSRRNSSCVFDSAYNNTKVMTLHVSKGLVLPVVALVGAGRMPAEGEDECEEARRFYLGAIRLTQRSGQVGARYLLASFRNRTEQNRNEPVLLDQIDVAICVGAVSLG
jgi:superfamily I DNA/RNA helicase